MFYVLTKKNWPTGNKSNNMGQKHTRTRRLKTSLHLKQLYTTKNSQGITFWAKVSGPWDIQLGNWTLMRQMSDADWSIIFLWVFSKVTPLSYHRYQSHTFSLRFFKVTPLLFKCYSKSHHFLLKKLTFWCDFEKHLESKGVTLENSKLNVTLVPMVK